MLNIATPLQDKKQKSKNGKIEIMKPTFGEDINTTISDVLSQRYYDMEKKHIGEEKLQELVNCFINKVSELHFPFFDIFFQLFGIRSIIAIYPLSLGE